MRRRGVPYLLILPAAGLFATLFVAPFVYFFVVSFWRVKTYRLIPDFTVANYAATFAQYLPVVRFAFAMALIVGLLTTVLGFLYAYIIRFKAGRWGPLLLFAALTTLFGGYLLKIYAWQTILGNEGVLNSALLGLGIIDAPITALLYSPGALVATLIHFLLPFAVLPTYGALRGIRTIELEAAR